MVMMLPLMSMMRTRTLTSVMTPTPAVMSAMSMAQT